MKEEREKDAARLAGQEEKADIRYSNHRVSNIDSRKSIKEDRRRIAQLQQLENHIADLEKKLADLGRQLENPPVDAGAVAKLGKEYESVQTEMDVRLNEWEGLQG